MKNLLGLVVLAITLGCAALTPEELVEREDRAYDREIKLEKYEAWAAACKRGNGIIYVQGRMFRGMPSKGARVQCISKKQLGQLLGS